MGGATSTADKPRAAEQAGFTPARGAGGLGCDAARPTSRGLRSKPDSLRRAERGVWGVRRSTADKPRAAEQAGFTPARGAGGLGGATQHGRQAAGCGASRIHSGARSGGSGGCDAARPTSSGLRAQAGFTPAQRAGGLGGATQHGRQAAGCERKPDSLRRAASGGSGGATQHGRQAAGCERKPDSLRRSGAGGLGGATQHGRQAAGCGAKPDSLRRRAGGLGGATQHPPDENQTCSIGRGRPMWKPWRVGEAELRAGAGLAGGLDALRHRLHQQLPREGEERVEEPALARRAPGRARRRSAGRTSGSAAAPPRARAAAPGPPRSRRRRGRCCARAAAPAAPRSRPGG